MTAFSLTWQADLRLAILQVLAADEGGGMNDLVLRMHLERFRRAPSLAELRDELAWLAATEQCLVKLEMVGSSTVKARITARGEDCAQGRTVVSGVLRPTS